jgi:hypothetical protein
LKKRDEDEEDEEELEVVFPRMNLLWSDVPFGHQRSTYVRTYGLHRLFLEREQFPRFPPPNLYSRSQGHADTGECKARTCAEM